MLTQARLKELLHYDPESGVFTWRVNRGGSAKPWSKAGADEAYPRIRIQGTSYLASRLAVFYMTGQCPDTVILKDGNPLNTAYDNLIPMTKAEARRRLTPGSKNKLGVKGVSFYSGLYHVRIRLNNTCHYLGGRKTLKEAANLYQQGLHEFLQEEREGKPHASPRFKSRLIPYSRGAVSNF